MTVYTEARYAAASDRNVVNFLNRFHKTNKAAEEKSDINYLDKFKAIKDFNLDSLKSFLGVRIKDNSFDNKLSLIVEQVLHSREKEVKAVKVQVEKVESVDQNRADPLIKGLVDARSVDPVKKAFKKGTRQDRTRH